MYLRLRQCAIDLCNDVVNRLALWSTCVLVLIPTTLLSLPFSLIGLLAHPSATLAALLGAGWFGIVTLWSLFLGLIQGRPPKRPRVVWAGLIVGSVVSLYFMVWDGSTGTLIFGWPLIAALHLGNEFSKSYPMGSARSEDTVD